MHSMEIGFPLHPLLLPPPLVVKLIKKRWYQDITITSLITVAFKLQFPTFLATALWFIYICEGFCIDLSVLSICQTS